MFIAVSVYFCSRKHVHAMNSPLNPNFINIAKLGYAGVYLFFLFLIQNIDCGYSLERVPTIYVLSKNKKKHQFFSTANFQFSQLLKSLYAWVCFHNVKEMRYLTRTMDTFSINFVLARGTSAVGFSKPRGNTDLVRPAILWAT